jgi:Ferritin-like domain
VSGEPLAPELTLEELDCDGALREAHERLGGRSRGEFLRTLAVGGGGLVAALALPARASGATRNDVDILNYALTLEYLQASFYTEAERLAALGRKAALAARVVGAVERAHVTALRKALGSAAVERPRFNFRDTTEVEGRFLRTAVALEDLAAAAYKAQAPLVNSKAYLAAAVAIHSVEARHAAWMRRLVGLVPATTAFDQPLGRPAVLRIVGNTDFIVGQSRTTGRGKPPFTG